MHLRPHDFLLRKIRGASPSHVKPRYRNVAEHQVAGFWGVLQLQETLWRYGVRVSTAPSQGADPGSNPGIATKRLKCNPLQITAALPPIAARRLPPARNLSGRNSLQDS